MGAVDVGVAPVEDDAGLVGAEDISGAEDDLIAGGDAAARGHDVVVAVAFIEFGAFDGVVAGGVGCGRARGGRRRRCGCPPLFIEEACAIGGHFADVQDVADAGRELAKA